MKPITHQGEGGAATAAARRVQALAALVLLGATGIAAAQADPSAVVRAMSRDLAAAAGTGSTVAAADADARLEAMVAAAARHTDFERMAQLVLERRWEAASPEQQRRFVEAFRTMLIYTFAEQIAQVVDEDMVLSAAQTDPTGTLATVRGRMKSSSGPAVEVQYRLTFRDGQWKLFDLSLEGMSLVTTYRNSFAAQARRLDMDALIQRLVARNRGLQAG